MKRGHVGTELQLKTAASLSIERDDNPEYSLVKALNVGDGSPSDVSMMLFWDKSLDLYVYRGSKSKMDKERRKSSELLTVFREFFRTTIAFLAKSFARF